MVLPNVMNGMVVFENSVTEGTLSSTQCVVGCLSYVIQENNFVMDGVTQLDVAGQHHCVTEIITLPEDRFGFNAEEDW